MRPSLHRVPRESKVAAVVLGAALVQVGVLAAFGLRSAVQRRRAADEEIADRADRVVRTVVETACSRVAAQEGKLALAMDRVEDAPYAAVQSAVAGGDAPCFAYGYLMDAGGRLQDCNRPQYEAPAGTRDEAARTRLDEVLRLERSDPVRAIDSARALADDLGARASHDVVAAAVALAAGRRAAYTRKEYDRALTFATDLLKRYRAVRDDRGALGDSEPMGLAASAVVCDVLLRSLVAAPQTGSRFVSEVVDRRRQAQCLGPLLSDGAFRVEVEACERLLADASVLDLRLREELKSRLRECDEVDRARDRASQVPRGLLVSAASAKEPTRFTVDAGTLLVVFPIRPTAGCVAAAFVAPPSSLVSAAVLPAARAVLPPEGVAIVVRDASGRDLLGTAEGATILRDLPFGPALPGLVVNAVLVDPAVVAREAESARQLWLWILVGASLAVVAASLLAVRAVLREVRVARMKSDFASNLSHELRTPLTSLKMFVDTLQEGRVRDDAERQECLAVIAQEADRLHSLVERVLQFASLSRGRAPIELKSSHAGEVVRRAVQVFRKRAEAAKASVELEVAPDLPESILDRDAMVQVLLNLLDNAVKHAGHDGAKIRVSVRSDVRDVARAAADERGVVIDVEDDGPGVPEKERELVFEEFYRGDDSLSRRVEGAGIGLALSRRIVLAHGGRVACMRSPSLGGALFRVTIPPAASGRRLLAAGSGRVR